MIINNRFEILKGYENNYVTIGFGSYGQVKLAKDIQSGKVVAVKVINKIAKNEITMQKDLFHPKIIKLLDVHIDKEREITYMVLEYADDGTLYEKIKMQTISKRFLRKYFKDVCEAICYLHSNKIMHRDIKPENILLTKNNQAKLCDFGFAAILGERKTLCGTYEYMSPQMIQNRPYDFKIDIWALGILYFEMIAGHAPFRGDKPQEVLQQMKTKIYFCERFQEQDIGLIKMILRVTPHKRPTIQEILEHPILKDIVSNRSSEQEMNKSTTSTQESNKKGTTTGQYLSESCNPKKMGELQKILMRENQKNESQGNNQEQGSSNNEGSNQNNVSVNMMKNNNKQMDQSNPIQSQPMLNGQKQTYPPIYIPKTYNKLGYGISVPADQVQGSNNTHELKSHSPNHFTKVNPNQSISIPSSNKIPINPNSLNMNQTYNSLISPKYPQQSQQNMMNSPVASSLTSISSSNASSNNGNLDPNKLINKYNMKNPTNYGRFS